MRKSVVINACVKLYVNHITDGWINGYKVNDDVNWRTQGVTITDSSDIIKWRNMLKSKESV